MKTKPAHEIRLGRVRATIWPHETEGKTWYNVTFSRLYVGEDGQWTSSESFGREDLPLLVKVADQAHTWFYQERMNSQPVEQPASEAA
jgi:hypothetical protein